MKYAPIKMDITTPDGVTHKATGIMRDNVVMTGGHSVPGVDLIDVPLSMHLGVYSNEYGDMLTPADIGETIMFAINDGSVKRASWDDDTSFAITEGDPFNPVRAQSDSIKLTSPAEFGIGEDTPVWLVDNQAHVEKIKSAFPGTVFMTESLKSHEPTPPPLAVIAQFAALKLAKTYEIEVGDAVRMPGELIESVQGIEGQERKFLNFGFKQARHFDDYGSSNVLSEKTPAMPDIPDFSGTVKLSEMDNHLPGIPTSAEVGIAVRHADIDGKQQAVNLLVVNANTTHSTDTVIAAYTDAGDDNISLHVGRDADSFMTQHGLSLKNHDEPKVGVPINSILR